MNLLTQALLAAAGGVLVAKLLSRRSSAPALDCSGSSTSGGTIEGIRYLETVRGSADPNAAMPMVIVFHSRGATPEGAASFGGIPGPVRIIRPAGFNRTGGGGYTWFSSSSHDTATAEALTGEMRQRATQLATFIGKLMRCRPTLGRPIVTGSSEGGHVSYLLASRYPVLLGGAVALLGYIPSGIWSSSMAPTVGLHTKGDPTISYSRTAAFWSAVQAGGAPLTTQTFEGGHEVVPPMASAWRSAVASFVEKQRSP